MDMLRIINQLEDVIVRFQMFISRICKNKTEFKTFEEFIGYNYENEHPMLSKVHVVLNKGVVVGNWLVKKTREV